MMAPQSEQLGASSLWATPAKPGWLTSDWGADRPTRRLGELLGQAGGLLDFRAVQRGDAGIFLGLSVLGQELISHPAEDVIHDGLGEADLGVIGPAAGLEAHVAELVAEHLERHAVLQGQGDRGGE